MYGLLLVFVNQFFLYYYNLFLIDLLDLIRLFHLVSWTNFGCWFSLIKKLEEGGDIVGLSRCRLTHIFIILLVLASARRI